MARLFSTKSAVPKLTMMCGECGLYRTCQNPKMPHSGNCAQGILFVAGRLKQREAEENCNLFGRPRTLLQEALSCHGIDLDNDCAIVHATGCVGDKTEDYKFCRGRVARVVEKLKPRVVIPLGPTAIRSVIGRGWNTGGKPEELTMQWRGLTVPDRDWNCWIAPTLDVRAMAMMAGGEGKNANMLETYKTALRLDMAGALAKMATAPKFFDPNAPCHVLDEPKAIEWLIDAMAQMDVEEFPLIAFDYETTGLKPYNKGHKIFCVSFCRSLTESVAFMMTDALVPYVKTLLERDRYKKVAANAKFEVNWSKVILDIDIKGLYFDTMQASHILDNRKGINSVKFQTFVRFGVPDYSVGIKKWLESVDKTANGVNRIFEGPRDEILRYCAVDSLVEYRMGVQMMGEIGIDCGGRVI
jgi:uracil-DNA glycosylase